MKKNSFWEQTSFLEPYDLVVIGAGIVGLSSALFYKRTHPDARILILDKGFIPEGASTRNAGFACIGSITEHVADMAKETEENIKNRIMLRYKGLQLLRGILGDENIGYENCGGYEVFTSPQQFEEANEHVPRFNKWMTELLGQPDVYTADTLNGYPVIYNRLDGALHPGKMMQELIRQVMISGCTIRWNSNVESLNELGNVTLSNGRTLLADQLLVASNGFTKRLLPDVDISPARGAVMVSKPWSSIPWKGTFNHDRGFIYFRNVGDRLLLGGARNIDKDEEEQDSFGINKKIKNHLLNFAKDKLLLPDGIAFEYEWSGIMGFTPSKTPVLERLDDHRVIATGLSGMGIAIGMKVGKKAAELLDDK